jgi:16S rRNA (guanine527-N7)-methyltransferase
MVLVSRFLNLRNSNVASLKKTIEMFELEVPNEAYPKLKHYCQVLWEINQDLNLTRHTSYELFVTRDLLDTIELSKLIPEGKEVLDVGSGGGVPGMILAILRPDLKVSLTDSVGKKAAALGEIADHVGLSLEIYQCRAEELLEDFRYDYTTARAVGPLKKMGTWFADCWPSLGRLLAVKGPKWVDEKAEADELGLFNKVDIRVVAQYDVPGVDWQSVILQLKASK